MPFAQVIFDSDPATPGKQDTLQKEEMSQAMIRWLVTTLHVVAKWYIQTWCFADLVHTDDDWQPVNDSYARCYRGMMDENNEQFVAYFVPTQETLRKRQRDTQDSVSYQEGEEYAIHNT